MRTYTLELTREELFSLLSAITCQAGWIETGLPGVRARALVESGDTARRKILTEGEQTALQELAVLRILIMNALPAS